MKLMGLLLLELSLNGKNITCAELAIGKEAVRFANCGNRCLILAGNRVDGLASLHVVVLETLGTVFAACRNILEALILLADIFCRLRLGRM